MFYFNCHNCTIILNIYYCKHWLSILNCMIQYKVCNDKGKYCAILWAGGSGKPTRLLTLKFEFILCKPVS